jgi:hypothetical protein
VSHSHTRVRTFSRAIVCFFTELANGIKSPPRQTSSRTLEHTVPRLVASSVAASLRERQAFDSNAGLGRLVDREHLPGREPPFWEVKRPTRPHKSAYRNDLLWETLRALNRLGRARTVCSTERASTAVTCKRAQPAQERPVRREVTTWTRTQPAQPPRNYGGAIILAWGMMGHA